jgi:transcription elongation factor Elf1
MDSAKSEESPAVDIRCPRCDSDKVTVCEDPQGHFQVTECANCGYTKECQLKDME